MNSTPNVTDDGDDEAAFADEVVMTLGRLLARIAIALKGPQLPLRLHSYHDLPEFVEKLVLEALKYREAESSHLFTNDGEGYHIEVKCVEALDDDLPTPYTGRIMSEEAQRWMERAFESEAALSRMKRDAATALSAAPPVPAVRPDEMDLGDYIAKQDPATQQAIKDAQPWARNALGLPPVPAVSGWMPIDSAPKHTPIRLYAQGGGFYDEDFNQSGSVEGHWSDDTGWCGAFWNPEQDCWDRRDGIVPTHWMPLPPAPSSIEGDAP